MCFWIDRNARRPRQRVAWKVMRLCYKRTGGYLYSMNYYRHDKYTLGDTIVAKNETAFPEDVYARGGVYVYTDLAEAQRWNWTGCAIVKVYVNPKDWLQSSASFECMYGRVRTYQKVRIAPPSDQPYLKFA